MVSLISVCHMYVLLNRLFVKFSKMNKQCYNKENHTRAGITPHRWKVLALWLNPCIWYSLLCVCFRELAKLFCTESSHRKELISFLSSLINLLNVSDVRGLQTSITNPRPRRRVFAHSRSAPSFSVLSITHEQFTASTVELTAARTNRQFPWGGGRVTFTLHCNSLSSLWSCSSSTL